MEWWQILIILFVAGCIAEEIIDIIVKAYITIHTKEKNDKK